jgi:hypothetical protein
MRRIILGDSPPKEPSDFDPCLELTWVDSHGVECQTVLVGTVAVDLATALTAADLSEGAACHGTILAAIQVPLLRAAYARARDLDHDPARRRRLNRLGGYLGHAVGKVLDRVRHVLTGF